MGKFTKKWAMLPPALAIASGGAAGANGATHEPRALALEVVELGDSVELALVAQSQVAQQVSYTVELTGTSTARHRGDTQIPAGERQVLSRLKSNVAGGWCATVEVTEGSGASYTLTAGDCSEA